MGTTERRLRALTLVLAGVCLILLFVLAADQGPGSSSPATWWLLVAACASQLGATLAGRRRVPSPRLRIQIIVFVAAIVVFAAIALGESGGT